MSFMEALRKTVKYKGRKQEITRNSQFRVNHLEYRAAWKLLFAMCSDNNGRAQGEPVCTLPVGAEVPATTLPGRHGHSSRLPAVWLPSVHEIFRWTSWELASGQACVGKSLLPPVTPSQPGGSTEPCSAPSGPRKRAGLISPPAVLVLLLRHSLSSESHQLWKSPLSRWLWYSTPKYQILRCSNSQMLNLISFGWFSST